MMYFLTMKSDVDNKNCNMEKPWNSFYIEISRGRIVAQSGLFTEFSARQTFQPDRQGHPWTAWMSLVLHQWFCRIRANDVLRRDWMWACFYLWQSRFERATRLLATFVRSHRSLTPQRSASLRSLRSLAPFTGSLTHFAHSLVGQLKFMNMCSCWNRVQREQSRFLSSLETRPYFESATVCASGLIHAFISHSSRLLLLFSLFSSLVMQLLLSSHLHFLYSFLIFYE